ncbi:heterokaryon incompatibility protein-domain-containing protein [Amylocarpus encephaloides]|uniref:Heterokaryon incompatibility protein-domain-containing protein n=1 Tax=Amylocarpus encephaloides TaxID=45428 RepID=A0A9P7YCC2_9HELO|nr:heterokaryon incompatibility protein-domain-containing protein [Amylocarpus encephaloides]
MNVTLKGGSKDLTAVVDLSVSLFDPAVKFRLPIYPQPSSDASEDLFETARVWLSKCIQTHHCSRAVPFFDQQFLNGSWPKRLVDVDAFPWDDTRVQLVENPGPTINYATLSYCWGTVLALHEKYITTRINLGDRKERILIHSLPRTLQDAIIVARRLEIKYLWVDALCIVQDSSEDWGTESAKMGVIYSQAQVTICSDAGPDCDYGLFGGDTDNQTGVLSRLTPGQPKEGKLRNTWTYNDIGGRTEWLDDTTSISEAPLQSRAWALQERLLSSRILHYGSRMMYWECRKHLELEEFIDPQALTLDKTFPSFIVSMQSLDVLGGSPARQLIGRWYREIIEDYSRRNLSNPHDKFPAISAVAKLIAYHSRSKYLAGLWLLDLQQGLYWKSVGNVTRSSTYIAPSFSWAAYNSPVRWIDASNGTTTESAGFQVEGFVIEAVGKDAYGRISKGSLTLRGYVVKAKTEPLPSLAEYAIGTAEEGSSVKHAKDRSLNPNASLITEGGERCGTAHMDTFQEKPSQEVLCLLLKRSWNTCHMLLLAPKAPSDVGYRRVGVGSISDFVSHNEGWFKGSPGTTLTLI